MPHPVWPTRPCPSRDKLKGLPSPAISTTHSSYALDAIDSPLMRHADADLLSLALIDARNHSLNLLGKFQALPAGGALPAHADLNPPLWLMGHVAWFQELITCRRGHGGAELASIDPQADALWDAGRHSAAARWLLAMPSHEAVRAYLLATHEAMLEALAAAHGDDDSQHVFRLALAFEDQCGEHLVEAAQALGVDIGLALNHSSLIAARAPICVPATRWQLGSAATGFAWANERPMVEVAVPEFEIDAQVVNWQQLVEFVDDGGYDDAALWHPLGWQWLHGMSHSAGGFEGRRGPRYVDRIGVASGAVLQNRFGKPIRAAGSACAVHLTWWEADAFARWAGRRLPSEVEWEAAAHHGARQGFAWGDVWEWTASTYRLYAGQPSTAPQSPTSAEPWLGVADALHSAGVSYGSAKVMRGASFATRSRMRVAKARGFASAERDVGFVGFRTCAL